MLAAPSDDAINADDHGNNEHCLLKRLQDYKSIISITSRSSFGSMWVACLDGFNSVEVIL